MVDLIIRVGGSGKEEVSISLGKFPTWLLPLHPLLHCRGGRTNQGCINYLKELSVHELLHCTRHTWTRPYCHTVLDAISDSISSECDETQACSGWHVQNTVLAPLLTKLPPTHCSWQNTEMLFILPLFTFHCKLTRKYETQAGNQNVKDETLGKSCLTRNQFAKWRE